MRWTCRLAQDERGRCGRRSRVVLISRRWDQVRRRIYERRGLSSPVPRGERGAAVNTIARGMPDCFGVPAVTNSYAFFLHTRLRVHQTPGIPCALVFRGVTKNKARTFSCRENAPLRLQSCSAQG
jgi:hypothetical protein